jgi:hypothetical protein
MGIEVAMISVLAVLRRKMKRMRMARSCRAGSG